jgi:hypothetical protein
MRESLYNTLNTLWFFPWAKNVPEKAYGSGPVMLYTSLHDLTLGDFRKNAAEIRCKRGYTVHSSILYGTASKH